MSADLELNGLAFSVRVERDEAMGEPWKEHDGHGIVSDWQRVGYDGQPHKAPGERVLTRDHGSFHTYDFSGTLERATAEGWGLGDADKAKLAATLKREPTQREITVAAVEADFERLRAWCNDEWYWCYVTVTLLDVNGEETDERESLGGIDSDDQREYLDEVARELAQQIADRIGSARVIPAKPAAYQVRAP